MLTELPAWALMTATRADLPDARHWHEKGQMELTWTSRKEARDWARRRGWPTPFFGFKNAFIKAMLASDDAFAQTLQAGGIDVVFPLRTYAFSAEQLAEMDEAYADGSWGWLVEALREIRRAVQAGVVVTVDGTALRSFQAFYSWAHGRYYRLEDDTNTGWIGSDEPSPGGW